MASALANVFAQSHDCDQCESLGNHEQCESIAATPDCCQHDIIAACNDCSLHDSNVARELRLNVGGTVFFQDNEYDSPLMDGYTLPGFRLTPTLSYAPSQRVKLEAGAYLLRYWGADTYPIGNYTGIPQYSPDHNTKGVHALPFVRATIDTGCGLRVVLGNLYGALSHHLIAPLYAPELALTADPEAGAQLLYSCRWLDADLWVDWRDFIYYDSPHQERFHVGLSAKLKYNSPSAPVHIYSPVQALIEHRGGEIDTIHTHSVQTLMNFAAGIGADITTGRAMLRSVSIEACALASWQQAGHLWPYDHGTALWLKGTLHMRHMQAMAGVYSANKYVSISGLPLWSTLSTSRPGVALDKPATIYLGYQYSHTFAHGVRLTAYANVYDLLGCYATDTATGERWRQKSCVSFDFGAKVDIDLSFMLKRL